MAGAIPVPGEDHTDYGDFLIDVEKVGVITERNDVVIITHSKDDFVVPFTHGEILAQALPRAEFMVFEDKNQMIMKELELGAEVLETIQGEIESLIPIPVKV